MKINYTIILLILIVASSFKLKGQKIITEDLFSSDILEMLSKGELKRYQASRHFSKIGDHRLAMSFSSTGDIELGFDTIRELDIDYYKTFVSSNAIKEIEDASKNSQIVMINEAHENTQHRVFTKHLLKGLYDNGYRYLFIEALPSQKGVPREYQDTMLHERKYLLDSPISGIDTTEPQYSNMVREALILGYKVLAYNGRGRNRENESVKNIGETLKSDASAKMIIHCGWSHIYEHRDTTYKRTWLGKKIQDSLGIDPLTVNQVILTERPASKESPFYELMDFDEPTVFLNSRNEFYNGYSNNQFFDILLFQPTTKYIHNRPNWLINQKDHQLVEIKTKAGKYPCLVKAYKIDDGQNAVPIDVIEKKSKKDPCYLVLPSGSFRVEISNREGLFETQKIQVK